MPELGDIYSNFFSDEHMCMRAAESDGAGRREGEEKSGATLYDRMQLVESWFTLMGEAVKKEGGKIILYTWCLEWISLLTRNLHITSIYFSSHRLPIDRSSPRPHRRQELSLHSLVGLFNSAPGPGRVDRVVVVLRVKISWSNSLFIQAWYVTTFPSHIPPLTDVPIHSQ